MGRRSDHRAAGRDRPDRSTGPTGPTGAQGAGYIGGWVDPSGVLVLEEWNGVTGDQPVPQQVGSVIGPIGPTGPTGPQGVQGAVGASGAIGPDGKVMWSFLGDGINGQEGHLYRTTTPVDPGAQPPAFRATGGATPAGYTDLGDLTGRQALTGPLPTLSFATPTGVAAGGAPTVASAQGPTGTYTVTLGIPQGMPGITPDVLTGLTGPNSGQGKDGDLYVDTDSGDVFTKANGTWNKAGNIQGPMGPGITVQGPLPQNTDLATFTLPNGQPPQRGDAFILELVPGQQVDQSIPTYTPPGGGAARHEHGDFIFFDGTKWHNGGNVQGPKGDQGPAATVTAHVAECDQRSDRPGHHRDRRASCCCRRPDRHRQRHAAEPR